MLRWRVKRQIIDQTKLTVAISNKQTWRTKDKTEEIQFSTTFTNRQRKCLENAKKYHKRRELENAPYVLSSSTFPSKSHVLSINRDEVTLFQVRAIRYDLRIFGLVSLDTSFVRPLCALWGAGRSRP